MLGCPDRRSGGGRTADPARLGGVNARSALFDLYGDHLLERGAQAPVAALVRLLAPLGISAPAVRTAVSRMVRQGWLEPVRLPGGAGYRLTGRAASRLARAGDRIYATDLPGWDGRWHVIVIERVGERARRERLRAALGYLGYACVDGSTWVSPRPSPELDALLAAERVRAERFMADYDGDDRGLASRAWDIDGLARAYRHWLDLAGDLTAGASREESDEAVFVVRSRLVHEWRKFLFIDPGLPLALLPAPWPGQIAADFFHRTAAGLLPAAGRFVDCCLAADRREADRPGSTGSGRTRPHRTEQRGDGSDR